MKIGIASDNEVTIAQHFGRTKGFVVTELVEGMVTSRKYRENTFSHHSQQVEHEHVHKGGHGHSHDRILEALKDCDVVIARGMGRRIYDDLRGVNIQAVITDIATIDEAINAYISNTLVDNPEKGCVH